MTEFWEIWATFTLIIFLAGVLLFAFILTAYYLWVTGILWIAFSAMLGLFFALRAT